MREQGRGRGRDVGREGGRVMTVSSGRRWRKERNCGKEEMHGERRRDRDNTGIIKRARMDGRLKGGGGGVNERKMDCSRETNIMKERHNDSDTEIVKNREGVLHGIG